MGITLEPETSKSRRGKEATYRVAIHKNGSIFIGATYTQAIGLKSGDEFEVKLGYKHIHLVQMDGRKTGTIDQDEG